MSQIHIPFLWRGAVFETFFTLYLIFTSFVDQYGPKLNSPDSFHSSAHTKFHLRILSGLKHRLCTYTIGAYQVPSASSAQQTQYKRMGSRGNLLQVPKTGLIGARALSEGLFPSEFNFSFQVYFFLVWCLMIIMVSLTIKSTLLHLTQSKRTKCWVHLLRSWINSRRGMNVTIKCRSDAHSDMCFFVSGGVMYVNV
jgi:hypothetical protein